MSVAMPLAQPGRVKGAWSEHRMRRRRRMLAQAFEAVLQDAHDPPTRFQSARVPVQRDQVLEAEAEIERLIGRLRGGRPLREAGLREARALLIDRGSPVFEWALPGTLRRRVRVVCEAVE